jgi:NAD(P)-dependent dehydrogenase (short-subunit alcohol dehydrogenase family)
MDLQLHGKRAIVTGGSRGLGKAIARHLAEEGVDMVVAARGRESLEAAAVELAEATGRRIVAVSADVSSDSSVDALIATAIESLGGVDILINNAAAPGAGKAARIADIDATRMLSDIDVKIGGYLRTARSVVPHMVKNGWGRIINIGGLAAHRTGNYVGALRSAAVTAITKNLADEFGRSGIGAIAIHPGFLRTATADAAAEERARHSTTNGRLIELSEVAWLVTMLASPKCIAINGETIRAGGGTPGVIYY